MGYLRQLKKSVVFLFCFIFNIRPVMNASEFNRKKENEISVQNLYNSCLLQNALEFNPFQKALNGIKIYNPMNSIIAICDFTLPSTVKRFFLIDLKNKKLLANSYVAHGKNSGELIASNFSNDPESYKSSKGFFRIGERINSPKHGSAILLEGLEKGVNDNARKREIIIHGATYVSDKFIRQTGRCGRSQGCPALPKDVMELIAKIPMKGALLYIHTN